MPELVIGSKKPKSRQIARILEQRISNGIKVPAYRDIAAEFDVSLNVVQRAFQELKKQNLVIIQHGKPVTPNKNPKHAPRVMSRFGFIHPYGRYSSFGRSLQVLADESFENVHAMTSIRSSGGNPARERAVAESMLYNGIEGLLLSKCPSEQNTDFFRELSEKIPLVLIDTTFKDLNLPAVVFDFRPSGYDICTHMFKKKKASRMLVLMDEHLNESMSDCLAGIEEAASEMSLSSSIIVHHAPLKQATNDLSYMEYGTLDKIAAELTGLIESEKIDSLFCPLNEFIGFGVADSEIIRKNPSLKVATFRGRMPFPGPNIRSYSAIDISTWWYDYDLLFSTAVDFFRKKAENGHRPRGIRKIKILRKAFSEVYQNAESGAVL